MSKVRRKMTRQRKRPVKRAKAKSRSGWARKGKRRRGWWWRLPLKLGFAAAIVGLIIGCIGLLAYAGLARQYDLTKLGRMPARSIVYDRNGEEIGRLHGSNRVVVPLIEVSPHFVDALLIREDARFYDHKGIDPIGVARAVYRNVAKNKTEGASTITMQLARNSFSELMTQKTLHRKLVEVMLSRRIEKTYTKDQILEFYVNRIFFGSGMYGVELASQSYFGKPAIDMTLSESAMLAGIIRGPNAFSPFRHEEKALSERDTVLKRMLSGGIIDQSEHDAALEESIRILPQSKSKKKRELSYALDAVRRDLERALQGTGNEDGGLKIYTSIDLRLQRAAETALERSLLAAERRSDYQHQTKWAYQQGGGKGDPAYLQGAVVLLDNQTGGTLAMVGGRDIEHSQFNRATSANRPIGSAFKPFVYTTAFEEGMMPGTLVDDGPLHRGEIHSAGSDWHPKNADGRSLGMVGADLGLIKSRNTMSVRVGDHAGLKKVSKLARRTGIEVAENPDPQIFLGNLNCDLETLTSAYTVFPNTGRRVPAFTISRIEDPRGKVFYRAAAQSYAAAPAAACAMTSDILQKVLGGGGTGARARRLGFSKPAAGKTGTTDDSKDAWFVGYTNKVTCGVWAGLDTPKTIFPGAYGSNLALPVWTELMLACEQYGYPAGSLKPAVSMAEVRLCRSGDHYAEAGCEHAGTAYTARIPHELSPRANCEYHNAHTASAPRRALPVKRPKVLRKIFRGE